MTENDNYDEYNEFDKEEDLNNNEVNQTSTFVNNTKNQNSSLVNNQNDIKTSDNNNNNNTKQDRIETTTVWELEVWKKSEQTKFKAYLKQIEVEFINRLAEETQMKEDKREKEFKQSLNELQTFINKTKKKAHELENRENKISLIEEEIKLKLNEMSRQITSKNDEIMVIQKKSKDEKLALDREITQLKKTIANKQSEIEEVEQAFRIYKKEIEESPSSILKMELNKRAIEIEELNKEKERILSENKKLKININKLKEDFILLKKNHDNEKEALYKQKLEEIEKLKFEIYNQKQFKNEVGELNNIKEAINELKNKETNDKSMKSSLKKQYKIVTLEKKANNSNNYNASNDFNNAVEKELDRLSNMRSQLLSSGQYNENDKLILGIDEQLHKLLQ